MSVNVCTIMGRLTADPELKKTSNDVAVVSFCVAVDRNYTKQGEEKQADFIEVVAWRSTAEFVTKYFNKGKMIAVTGEWRTETYTDKDGNKRKSNKLQANTVSFCGGKQDDGTNSNNTSLSVTPQTATEPFETDITDDDDLPF